MFLEVKWFLSYWRSGIKTEEGFLKSLSSMECVSDAEQIRKSI